jgi:hypothetical protein
MLKSITPKAYRIQSVRRRGEKTILRCLSKYVSTESVILLLLIRDFSTKILLFYFAEEASVLK